MHKWCVYPTFSQASQAAADFLAQQILSSIADKQQCHVVLPGGNSPAECLGYLKQKQLPWQNIHWYLTDERCYPVGHEERNDTMLQRHLWSSVPPSTVHLIPTELGAEEAAARYRQEIAELEYFDIALLGMGEDGHTASLFPGNPALTDRRSVVPVYDAPKTPAKRVSLSVEVLSKVKCRMALLAGVAKAPVVSRIKSGENLPINQLGDIVWYLDEAAASDLP